jgi:hypothetical protein
MLTTISGSLFVAGTLVSFGWLVQKEFAGTRSDLARVKLIGQVFFIGIAPLLIVFLLVVIQSMTQMMH